MKLSQAALDALRELAKARALDSTQLANSDDECKIEYRNENGNKELYISGTIGYRTDTSRISDWLSDQDGNITIGLNSGGGDAWEGIAINSQFANYDRGKVTMRIDGRAASAAGIVFLAGDNRQMMPNARLMLHEVTVFGFVEGNKKRIKQQLENILAAMGEANNAIVSAVQQTTGYDAEKAKGLVSESDRYFTADFAVKSKLATEVLQPKKGKNNSTDSDESLIVANREFATQILGGLFQNGNPEITV